VIDRLRALGRTREAREAAEAKLAVWPDAADLRLAAAELAAAAGDAAGAAGHLEKLLPSIDGARLADRAAACYLQAGLLAAARAKLEAFLHRWPSDGGLLLDSAELRLLRGDRKGAAAAAARAEGDLPPRRGAALASLWRRLHEPRRALALLDGLLARGGYDAGLWLEKAETHALLFEKDAAHKALANALAPGAPPVEPLRVARVRQLLLEFSEEVEALKRVVAEPGASSAALAAAADAQADRGAKSDALSLLARAEERAPSLDQRRRIAAVYRRLAQCARARSVLAPVLSARPNEAVVLIEEGLNDAVCADARSARKALARLASAEPGPDADLRAPLILWRLGSKDEALARWSAAAASLPRPGDWWVEETIFALRRGDRELARAQLAKARAAEPGPSRRLDALERRAARGTP
jgi:hypothetical protein